MAANKTIERARRGRRAGDDGPPKSQVGLRVAGMDRSGNGKEMVEVDREEGGRVPSLKEGWWKQTGLTKGKEGPERKVWSWQLRRVG